MEHPSHFNTPLSQPDSNVLAGRERPLVVLKEGELFFIQTRLDDESVTSEGGLYYQDTRFLQAITWSLNNQRPLVLSSEVYDSTRAQIDLTNPDMDVDGQVMPTHSIHLRVTLIVADRLYQRVRLINFAPNPLTLTLQLRFAADFRDIFEIRGMVRPKRGQPLPPHRTADSLEFRYLGLDHLERFARVHSDPTPLNWEVPAWNHALANFRVQLAPRVKVYHYLAVDVGLQESPTRSQAPRLSLGGLFTAAAQKQARLNRDWDDASTRIESDNTLFNAMLRQATTDMRALFTEYPGQGCIVDAGIPWYVAPFGRDACITSIESLLLNPRIATESLAFLARFQGTHVDPWKDEEPGKILHELRRGEMVRCGEIPHTPYYGSVDSTLWWIIALYETWQFTNDTLLLRSLAEPLARSCEWLQHYADRDGDALIEYLRQSSAGLTNQGWKDSEDSVLDALGRPVAHPIALVEVQGYAFYAFEAAALMRQALGDDPSVITSLRDSRQRLRQAFYHHFWDPAERQWAYALDGHKHPLFVGVSNIGHLLFSGILDEEMAQGVMHRLFHPDLASGFGIRTLSDRAVSYNPMSYHNGTVWPHDNALIAWGLKTCQRHDLLLGVASQLYEAAQYFRGGRLPELYCGFPRRNEGGPVHYPVACDPQAWSSAVPFFLLRLMLGIGAKGNEVRIRHPLLPPWTNYIYLERLRVAGGMLSIEFSRARGITYANVIKTEGDIRVVIEPLIGS